MTIQLNENSQFVNEKQHREILLSCGKVTIVDAEDYEFLRHYKWCAIKDGNTWYVQRSCRIDGRRSATKMHRQILNAPPGVSVDHVDGNGLNNCRSNLRLCTQAQNMANSRWAVGKSGYRGVHKIGKHGWRAEISINNKTVVLGTFLTPEEAALAFNAAAMKYRGEFAILNQIQSFQQTDGSARGASVGENIEDTPVGGERTSPPNRESSSALSSINQGSAESAMFLTSLSHSALPTPKTRIRRSQSDWKFTFIDDRGIERRLQDTELEVNFAWCVENLHISRQTLRLAVKRNELQTIDGRPSMTRTDWVYQLMTRQKHTTNRRETCRLPRRKPVQA